MLAVEEQLIRIRRGCDQVVPEDELRKKLARSIATGKPLRVKYGIDPTGIDVHLGHTVPLRKLRVFQELGHHAVLIIGNYTALVGDPSGKDETRARLSQEQVEQNAKDYLTQIRKIVDVDKAEVRYNGEWFSKYTFLDTMKLLSTITMQRILERDDFTKRIKKGTPISMHECLYPLMQGQDSVEVRADVELGGSEQLFNLMRGRDLQVDAGQEPQICVTLPLLRGLDGNAKMGKSLANYIGVGELANEQFAKVMSIPDELMTEWFTLLTDRDAEEVKQLTNRSGDSETTLTHPMVAKKLLGCDIVGFYNGSEAAAAAQTEWERRFSQGMDPSNIPEVNIASSELENGGMLITKLLVKLGLAKSGNEARNKVIEGAVTIGPDRTKVTDPKTVISITDGLIVRIGNRRVVKVKLASVEA
jgi:tyrosyl-tRNA synthetase